MLRYLRREEVAHNSQWCVAMEENVLSDSEFHPFRSGLWTLRWKSAEAAEIITTSTINANIQPSMATLISVGRPRTTELKQTNKPIHLWRVPDPSKKSLQSMPKVSRNCDTFDASDTNALFMADLLCQQCHSSTLSHIHPAGRVSYPLTIQHSADSPHSRIWDSK
jgi:hypothetical protein